MPSETRLALLTDRLRLFQDHLRGDPGAHILRLRPGADGYGAYSAIRSRGPLVRSRRGLLFTATWSTANAILRSGDFGAVPTMVSGQKGGRMDEDFVHPLDEAFFSLDPPRHTRLRAAVTPWFSPDRLKKLIEHMEEDVDDCLRPLAGQDGVDLVGTLAEPVPITTVCRLLGVPRQDVPLFTRWGRDVAATLDGPRSPRDFRRTRRVYTEMTRYFRRHAWAERDNAEGLMTGLAAHCPTRLSERDVIATCGMMLLAGFVTTVNLIGNALCALLLDPHQKERSAGDWSAIVEETLRHSSPVQYVVRRARRTTDVQGHRVTAGTPVVVLLAGANRDPSVFEHPDEFNVHRPGAGRHLTFGAGIHYCLGVSLARAEARTVLSRFFEYYPEATLAGAITPRPSRVLHGPARLPVRLTARS
ncbi:cytochrome P450 [Streptomyces sp. TRM 70351]|uniref:cytochrome P450 n=1 Tax=Streptomyces sp. TRM 70351 TaxID=3116552 RepID=UPI002E7B766E|nr:cytochrome P450 [Streptomyces sp. TRM 70351]MEE1928869.1 cytochrome P450 [Streptomyces sp. TRM 70351]